jgi:hypothetical protein
MSMSSSAARSISRGSGLSSWRTARDLGVPTQVVWSTRSGVGLRCLCQPVTSDDDGGGQVAEQCAAAAVGDRL